jgi:hypothetical protein
MLRKIKIVKIAKKIFIKFEKNRQIHKQIIECPQNKNI